MIVAAKIDHMGKYLDYAVDNGPEIRGDAGIVKDVLCYDCVLG